MAKAKTEKKPEVEREYIIPLRKSFLKVPKYRRVPRAIKEIKEFLAKHMKVEGRDTSKIKINKWVNQEVWVRGIKYPPAKIKVKVKKDEEGNIIAELVDIRDKFKYAIAREEKKKVEAEKKKKEKEAAKKAAEEAAKKVEEEKKKQAETKEGKAEEKEKQEKKEAVKEAGIKAAEKQAKQVKHEGKVQQKGVHAQRKALAK